MVLRKGYDLKGKLKGILEARNETKRKKDVFLKVVTCFVIDKQTGEVLMEKRTGNGLNPYSYDLVSGHVDGDEIGFQAMIRELAEEVGIQIEESSVGLKKIQEYTPIAFTDIGNYLAEFYCLIRNSKDGLKLQEDEVEHIEWKTMQEVFDMISKGETRFPKDFNYEPIFDKIKEIYHGPKEQPLNRE